MLVKALNIQLGSTHIGILFQYELVPGQPITRFMPDEAFANERNAPTVSLSMKAAEPESQKLLWLDLAAPMFNGRISARNGALLPAFFQGFFTIHHASSAAFAQFLNLVYGYRHLNLLNIFSS